ncbi:MAG: uracil-DNA glycosylase family protein [Candidatus Sericytochromatia bacterium]|nr:uracil-DNA glycosylase family protein [Candidatus Sericytochromatia bacterium]
MSSEALIGAALRLRDAVSALGFAPPVTHVYNPLDHAWSVHEAYLRTYGAGPKDVVFVGMNPGPFGMAQTGVPFGEVAAVRDFLRLSGPVGQPPAVHPKRPVEGFACARSEVSGRRLWGAVADAFGTPEAFFSGHLVLNYCPLAFMEASGRNRTPDQLPAHERQPLFEACDAHLREAVVALSSRWVVGVGHFAEGRARAALAGLPVQLGRISHPSPASPAANRGWEALVAAELAALGLSWGQ